MQRVDAPSGTVAVAATQPGQTSSLEVEDVREPWRINVLILDDEVGDREWLAGQIAGIEEYEARVVKASSIAEATRLINEQQFDVAIVDYRLNDGYGDEVIRLLRQQQSACASILISSHTMSEVSLFGLRAGAMSALNKDDMSPGLLETTIRFALANRARIGADR